VKNKNIKIVFFTTHKYNNKDENMSANIVQATRLSTVRSSVGPGATPKQAQTATVTTTDAASSVSDGGDDWRVSLRIPSEILKDNPVFTPFGDTGNRMIFPLNPTIVMGQRSNYQSITPTHTNYAFHAYQNSQIEDILVTGDFFVQNSNDAKYWIACLHFLRTMRKMFYGSSSDYLGNPPLVTRLNGYGRYVLNDIPVLITQFTVDMTSDVDYIQCTMDDGKVNYVPTQSQFAVTCTPNYSRRTHSTFDLKKFAKGGFVDTGEGFV